MQPSFYNWHSTLKTFWAIVFVSLPLGTRVDADWPEFRGDRQRTSFRRQKIESAFWSPKWSFEQSSAPQPAWPKPARGSLWQNLTQIEARVIDDQANVPLIALDQTGVLHVLIASSSDDQLVSLDPVSGKVRWQVDAEGPIRYAPSIENGIAYFGSDDGLIRAVDIGSGGLKWKVQVGPGLPRIIGNQRLISPHPIRTSVVVSGNSVFANAGLFPSQGVYSVALDKNSGKLLWRRRIQKSPQGYLLTTADDRVYVPTGRSSPYAIDSYSGETLYDLPSPGGSFCMLTPDAFFAGPGNSANVQSYRRQNRAKMLTFRGRQVVAGDGRIWTANGGKLACHEMKKVVSGKEDPLIWSVDCKSQNALIVSGDEQHQYVMVAGDREIEVFDARTGRKASRIQLPQDAGRIVHLAISEAAKGLSEVLVGATDTGKVFCWEGVSSDDQIQGKGDFVTREVAAPKTAGPDGLDSATLEWLSKVKARLISPAGFALVVNDYDGRRVDALLQKTRLHIVLAVDQRATAKQLRAKYRTRHLYGSRVSVHVMTANVPNSYASELFNLVVADEQSGREKAAWMKLLFPASGVLSWNDELAVRPPNDGDGVWRHQYADPKNRADSHDHRVGKASAFRLQWFGGVGPSRMPDRHVRGPSPLAAGSTMILQTDGGLIGVDPANGTERWSLELPPETLRFVTPFDGGYACLDESGRNLFVATKREILVLDALAGKVLTRIDRPVGLKQQRWGYLSVGSDQLIASCMKHSAPRVASDRKIQRTYVDSDYRSNRPLVCSRQLLSMNPDGKVNWQYDAVGPFPNGSVSIDYEKNRMILVEGRSDVCQAHSTDRITANQILEKGFLVCLDTKTGQRLWQQQLKWPEAKDVLYSQISGDKLILATSESLASKARYHLRVHSIKDGKQLWHAHHDHIKSGLFHGEQVHHPVVLKRNNGTTVLVAEPFFYDLESGIRVEPGFAGNSDKKAGNPPSNWAIRRPGHSCGTLSGTGDCLFFRATNPTVLNLNPSSPEFTALAPSRPGCWINMIPATGRLLIPEASASCVCQFSLQTSMCFVPVEAVHRQRELPMLKDVVPETEPEEFKPVYGWRFDEKSEDTNRVKPRFGTLDLQSSKKIVQTEKGLMLDGKQWLCIEFDNPKLPRTPRTLSVEATIRIEESGEWGGILGAVQDNGAYERGFLLGTHKQRFFFAVAGRNGNRLTYLHSPAPFEHSRTYHLVGTYNGKKTRLFIDGKLVGESDEQSGPLKVDPKSWLAVGAYKDDNELYLMKGMIRSATVYQGAMTGQQVKDRFQSETQSP